MNKTKAIAIRFLKGAVAGSVTAMSVVVIKTPVAWHDFVQIFNDLGIAAVFGAVTGLLLALEKWASWTE